MATKFVALLISLLVALSYADYCNISTCRDYKKGEHTLCKFSIEPARACYKGDNLGGGLSESDKQNIIKLHNQLRQKVARGKEARGSPGPQPAAKSMPDLTWDDELAYIAQTWANQCDYHHDDCRDVGRYQVGQNIAYRGTTGDIRTINILDMVQSWYDEVEDYNRNDVAKFTTGKAANGEDIGHYTQMVWAKTDKIGCGERNYFDGKFKRKYLVCNYGPAGNMRTAAVYERR